MRSRLIIALLATGAAMTGCDLETVEAQPFESGVRQLTDQGAFNVALHSAGGTPRPGHNDFILEIAMPDPNDPQALGRGIPDARVNVTAVMPAAQGVASEAEFVRFMGNGRYLVSDLNLPHSGVWEVDVDIEVGSTMDEQVTFAFEL